MKALRVTMFRVIGGCVLFQGALFSRHIRVLWMYAHRGTLGVGITALGVVMFVSAIFGAATLLIPKRWAPYFLYASFLCSWVGGMGFSFVPLLMDFVPRKFWGLGLIVGNLAVVGCLAALQLQSWKSTKLVHATS
jgi:hypothetical protein